MRRSQLKKEVHSENVGKFLLISAEEKLNKAMYQAQELLARMNVSEDSSNYAMIQSLFSDCEIAKRMFRKLMLEVSGGSFLPTKVKELTETFTESFNTELRNFRNSVVFSADQMELSSVKDPAVCLDAASGSFMEDTVSSISDIMSEFASNLQDCRRYLAVFVSEINRFLGNI
ncbi:unnamed protein product [Soboliphyme baturini]|uniref:Vacuolar protein sorting-associated protein 51 homolog n=1 Tax=Soboliphyme baturini TaxID=241478 RepID=A0A183J8A9_9BILA|nr:unnamed protein product [Soboliphyme baturini]